MPKTVDVAGLSNTAKVYAPYLASLPFLAFNEVAAALKMTILEVDGEHIRVNKRRKAGILAPYTAGGTSGSTDEIMKFIEMKLKPERTYADLRDNVTNYDDVKVISKNGNFASNTSKKHPLELLITQDVMTSYGEDVVDCMFHAERNIAVKSPMTAFTGFNPKLDILTAGGLISTADKNLINTGAIAAATAYDQLVQFIGSANSFLRKNAYLYITESVLRKAKTQYKDKVKAHNDPTTSEMIEKLKDDAFCSKLEILTHPALGTGDRLMLTAPDMLDFGVNKTADDKFVQVRPIGDDPNDVQFWIQASYDTRINDVHCKVFQMNDQANTAPELAGDYR